MTLYILHKSFCILYRSFYLSNQEAYPKELALASWFWHKINSSILVVGIPQAKPMHWTRLASRESWDSVAIFTHVVEFLSLTTSIIKTLISWSGTSSQWNYMSKHNINLNFLIRYQQSMKLYVQTRPNSHTQLGFTSIS